MKLSTKNKGMIGLLLIVLLLFLYGALAIQPSGGTGATSNPGATSSTQQPLSCSNPQQCREIDEVWQRIGMKVRNSERIWDNSKIQFSWEVFTVVYMPPVTSSAPSSVLPDGTISNWCFPIERNSFHNSLDNWGNKRNYKDRLGVVHEGGKCHSAVDLLTKSEGKIVAIADGKVKNIYEFTECNAGKAMAILIYHSEVENGVTINYGEINPGSYTIKSGDSVKRGQVLGSATACDMLHFEMYRGELSNNLLWFPPTGAISGGYKNKCANEFLATKPPQLLDPTHFIAGITGNFCDGNMIASR